MLADTAQAAPSKQNASFTQAVDLHRQGRYADVLELVEPLLAAGQATLDLLNLAGVCAKRLAHPDLSERYYRAVLAQDAGHTATLNNLAVLLQETGRSSEAQQCYERAIDLAPLDPLPRLNLGNLHLNAKRLREAQSAYESALRLKPDMPEALRCLAEVRAAELDRPAARALLIKALTVREDFADAWQRLGDLWREDKNLGEAERCFRKLLEIKPKDASALNRLGEALQAQGRDTQAELLYRQALTRDAEHADALNNLGILLHERKAYAEAEDAYRRALKARPDYAEVWNNLAVLVQKLKRFDEAEPCYQEALRWLPDYAAARCNYGLLCLTQGRFEEGWPLYEARYAPGRTVAVPQINKPQWQGEPVTGKSLLIWSEQGLGDEIQFARYARILKDLGAKHIGLVCKKPLVPLLKHLDGVDTLHEEEQRFSVKGYDYWTFPLSIPRYLCKSVADIPAQPAYLQADPALVQRWQERLGAGLKIGLVWRGRAEYSNDANRSLPDLRLLAPLWQWPSLRFFSLQKGDGEAQAACPPPGQPMASLGPSLQDFADTAAVVMNLDLVITVDTSVAHLCGALGVRCWVLLPFVGTDWRWFLDREDTPWYPSLRLFRQPAPHDWGPVIENLTTALRQHFDLPAPEAMAASAEILAALRRLSPQDRALVTDLIERLQTRHAPPAPNATNP